MSMGTDNIEGAEIVSDWMGGGLDLNVYRCGQCGDWLFRYNRVGRKLAQLGADVCKKMKCSMGNQVAEAATREEPR